MSEDGVAVDPDKIARIRDWPTPTNQVELRSFLDLASYYRKFVYNFAKVASPLHALTGKSDASDRNIGKTLRWSEEADDALTSLKQALCSAPILTYQRFDREFVVEVDASLKGLGACLSQLDEDGKLRPVAFASRGLRGAELNYLGYSSFKLELLALKWAVSEKFREYTLGTNCIVYTDHNPLAHLKTANLGATEHRWVAQLASFDIDVRYRSGRSNRCADAPSRCPVNLSTEETSTALHTAMDSSLIPSEVRVLQPQQVEVFVSQVGLTPAMLPSYSPEQLARMQTEDQFIGRLWDLWMARWEPGQVMPHGDVPDLQTWIKEWPISLNEKGSSIVLYTIQRMAQCISCWSQQPSNSL